MRPWTARPPDGGLDGSLDSGDAADAADAADADISAALLKYAHDLASAYCTNLQTRCATYDAGLGYDAGQVDLTTCINQNLSGSSTVIDDSTLGLEFPNALGHNDITYDVDAGVRCINDVAALDLTNETTTAFKAMLADCYAVSHGTLPLNAPCYASLECAPNSWCDLGLYDAGPQPVVDAGDGGDAAAPVPPPTGLCVPLLDAGASCDSPPKINGADQTNNYSVTGVSCSYLGQSGNGAFCDTYANYGTDSTCIAGLIANDDLCPNNESCTSGLCQITPDRSERLLQVRAGLARPERFAGDGERLRAVPGRQVSTAAQ